MKCCNPRCCANWIYTTCHSSTFTSCSTSPCHTCNLAVLLYLASPPVSPPFPAPCIFAYFIIYGTMAHGSNSANSNSARKPISRSATIYGQTRSTLSSLIPLSLSLPPSPFFLSLSSPSSSFFNYSLRPRHSNLPLHLPITRRASRSLLGGAVTGSRGKSLPLRVRSSSLLAKRGLIDAYMPPGRREECKKFDGSRVSRQQGKSITRTVRKGVAARIK